MNTKLVKKLMIILMSFFFLSLNVQAEDKKISIDPNKQKVTMEFVEGGCFTYPGYNILKVDGIKMMILKSPQDLENIQVQLNNAKANNQIVDILSKVKKETFGQNEIFGQTTYCKAEVSKVTKISAFSKDEEKNTLRSKLVQCQQTVSGFATNINGNTGSSNNLINYITPIVSHNNTSQQ